MTSRRSTGNDRSGKPGAAENADLTAVSGPTSAIATSDDVSGKLAMLLAGFALAVAVFLIILVAISASNA